MCQNSRLPEGKQVFNINHVVCTNSLGTVLISSGDGGKYPKSKFPYTSQGPTFRRRAVRPAVLSPFCLGCSWHLLVRPRMPRNLYNAQGNSPQQRIIGSQCQQCCPSPHSASAAEPPIPPGWGRVSGEDPSIRSAPSFLGLLELNSLCYLTSPV